MKFIFALAFAVSLLTSAAEAGGTVILRATVLGSVTIQVPDGEGTKPEVSLLDNARIFTAFGVTTTSHVLVWFNGNLELRPKAGGSSIPILTSSDGNQITKTSTQAAKVVGPISSPQVTGIFASFDGTFAGKAHLAPGSEKLTISVIGASNGPTHLKFTLITGTVFVPQG